MVARQPSERTGEIRRVVGTNLSTGIDQGLPEAMRRLTEAAQPVANDVDADAGLGTLDQRIAEGARHLVVAKDIVLQENAVACLSDGGVPGIEIALRIDEQVDAVATDQRSAGGTAERLRSELAYPFVRRGGAQVVGGAGHPGILALRA